MIWIAATALLLFAAPFVLWPLLSHWSPDGEASPDQAEEAREREIEELELDLASGRLSTAEAARRRREVEP